MNFFGIVISPGLMPGEFFSAAMKSKNKE